MAISSKSEVTIVADEKGAAQALDAPTDVGEALLVGEPVTAQAAEPPEQPTETLKTTSSASRRVRARRFTNQKRWAGVAKTAR